MKTILVVDDEPSIAQIAGDYLRHGGFGVITASNGVDALALARAQRPDLIVLDLGLPRMDGVEVAKTLRREGNVPIIMLTARIEESDRLAGLELGADDYMTKPFSPRELVARVRSVLRRVDAAGAGGDVLRRGDLVIDTSRMHVSRNRRTRFERRLGALFWICVVLMFGAANTVLSWLLPGVTVIGPSFRSFRPLFGLFWLVLIFGFLFPAMRRFRSPLGDIVEAA